MNGAKILGYLTVSIFLIKCIASVIPEMFLEGRTGEGGGGGGGHGFQR